MATTLKLQAERKAGSLLAGMEMQSGARGNKALPRLDSMGITKIQSSRWKREVLVPEDRFQEFVVAAFPCR